jgi:hypothetical protein
MAVEHVSQREIVEVFYRTPEGDVKEHPALVLSTDRLSDNEDGMFLCSSYLYKEPSSGIHLKN